ncbi:MAG: hypothetical protein DRR42_18900 [Gammaproteobacteria bacterium]|nr:MAG: hypothetical protein DRR42_18900 [Gammaproteobacteria bacterium]
MTSLGMMQPYFYPYLGYFALIQRADIWVVFDDCQFIRRGWMDRNRILHPTEGWQYIKLETNKVPIGTPTSKVVIKTSAWADRIVSQLAHYKNRAPYFGTVIDLLTSSTGLETCKLHTLLTSTLESTCNYLGIIFNPIMNSEIAYDRSLIKVPGDWALTAANFLSVDEYINPPGGRDIFDKKQWQSSGIKLKFLTQPIVPYDQHRKGFVEHLSVIDAMMFNSPGEIREIMGKSSIAD